MKVSIIIPVYNAEKHVAAAVGSAVQCSEVAEVILVEDGSKDRSLLICQELNTAEEKVKLFTHDGNKNKGPGQSRNVGISKAGEDFLAFLDADDYFLPNRFHADARVFEQFPEVDGTYNLVGVEYSDKVSKEKHLARMGTKKRNILNPRHPVGYTGMEEVVAPKDLFYHLLRSDYGWIHLNGLTLKKDAIVNMRWFNDNFLGQDSEFITRISSQLLLRGASLKEAVAVRRVHSENRILQNSSRKNKESIDSRYWINYILNNRLTYRELRYLIFRDADHNNKLIKFFKIILSMFRVFLVVAGWRSKY